MSRSKQLRENGFTITELIIVVVVIAILALVSIVAYTNIQGRARDSKRLSDLKSITTALELYYADYGGYPICGGTGTYSGSLSSGLATSCLNELVPTYMGAIPTDPINASPIAYYYAVGYRKTGTNSYTSTPSNNYILGANMDGGGSNYTGWGVTLNYLLGSAK